jgi:hypothetical protein
MNNYNYFDYNWYREMKNNLRNTNLYGPKEGFEKGNIFSSLYGPYKNYKPATLKATTEQESLLYELSAYSFAAHDLNLYLDINPTDQSLISLFNDYRNKANELISEYEKKYGPLTINNATSSTKNFSWENSNWPWEVKDV